MLAGFPLFVPRCNICQQNISDKGLNIKKGKIKNEQLAHQANTPQACRKVGLLIGRSHQLFLPPMQVFKNG